MADEEQDTPRVEAPEFPLRRRRRGCSAEELAAIAAEIEQSHANFIAAHLGGWEYELSSTSYLQSQRRDLPSSEHIREVYERSCSLVVFANEHKLDRRAAIKALAGSGIDICQEVARDWEGGRSIRDLSNRHAVTRETIARWIRRSGRDIQPRNGNSKHDEDLIVRTFLDTNSVNQAAKAAAVHWATARRILKKHDALARCIVSTGNRHRAKPARQVVGGRQRS